MSFKASDGVGNFDGSHFRVSPRRVTGDSEADCLTVMTDGRRTCLKSLTTRIQLQAASCHDFERQERSMMRLRLLP